MGSIHDGPFELLQEFPKHYRPGLFEPPDLLKLLTGLQITAKVGEGEYIMPCLLPEIPQSQIDSELQVPMASPSQPLLVQYPWFSSTSLVTIQIGCQMWFSALSKS